MRKTGEQSPEWITRIARLKGEGIWPFCLSCGCDIDHHVLRYNELTSEYSSGPCRCKDKICKCGNACACPQFVANTNAV